MFDIGWQELIVIGVLALLVVGPKELPGLFRTVGQYVGKARSIAREFQRSMEDAARDVDGGALQSIKDAKRDFDKMARVDFSEQAKRSASAAASGGKPKAAGAAASASDDVPPVPDDLPPTEGLGMPAPEPAVQAPASAAEAAEPAAAPVTRAAGEVAETVQSGQGQG